MLFRSQGGEKRTLLIVEDDLGLQSQLRWHFEEYNVVVAVNRDEALTALRRERPAVILQDLGLQIGRASCRERV